MKPLKSLGLATVVNVVILSKVLIVFGNKKVVKAKGDFDEETKYASKCEVCKIVTSEIEYQLNSKFNSPEMIQTGYNYMDNSKSKKKTSYQTSLIRLQEAMESTCPTMLDYDFHKERTDSTRFERSPPKTLKKPHGLKNKGAKGNQDKMPDKPTAETMRLKSQCDAFLESYEAAIEKWYRKGSQKGLGLGEFICKKIISKQDQKCLTEVPVPIQHAQKNPATKKPKKSEL